jgi:hypothetical protein
MKCAVLFASHILSPSTLKTYAKIKHAVGNQCDVYWICDNPSAQHRLTYLPVQFFSITEGIMASWQYAMNGRDIVPGNCHIPMLAFAQENPYDFYWFVEYDVRFTGNWRSVFDLTWSSEADLIAACVEDPFDDSSWHHWPSVNLPYSKLARSFNPLYRVTHRVLDQVISLLSEGYWAHNEALIASVCLNQGWLIQDLNDLAIKILGRHIYTPDLDEDGTFGYRPVRFTSLTGKRGMLFHPVKPLNWFVDRSGVRRGLLDAWHAWRGNPS